MEECVILNASVLHKIRSSAFEKFWGCILNFWSKPSLCGKGVQNLPTRHPVRLFSTQRQTPLPAFLEKKLSRGKTSGKMCEVQQKPGSSISLHYALLRDWGSLPRTTSNPTFFFVAHSTLKGALPRTCVDLFLPLLEKEVISRKKAAWFGTKRNSPLSVISRSPHLKPVMQWKKTSSLLLHIWLLSELSPFLIEGRNWTRLICDIQ